MTRAGEVSPAEGPLPASGDRPRRAGGKRRQAREMALQMLYQRELGDAEPAQLLREFDIHAFRAETADAGASSQASELALDYARTLVEGSLAHKESIDRMVADQADNWRLERSFSGCRWSIATSSVWRSTRCASSPTCPRWW